MRSKRPALLDAAYGDEYDGLERTIDTHIKNLQKKIEPDPDNPKFIRTIYGQGYKLDEPG
jgi:DNA-binding response OmpR family regulator